MSSRQAVGPLSAWQLTVTCLIFDGPQPGEGQADVADPVLLRVDPGHLGDRRPRRGGQGVVGEQPPFFCASFFFAIASSHPARPSSRRGRGRGINVLCPTKRAARTGVRSNRMLSTSSSGIRAFGSFGFDSGLEAVERLGSRRLRRLLAGFGAGPVGLADVETRAGDASSTDPSRRQPAVVGRLGWLGRRCLGRFLRAGRWSIRPPGEESWECRRRSGRRSRSRWARRRRRCRTRCGRWSPGRPADRRGSSRHARARRAARRRCG